MKKKSKLIALFLSLFITISFVQIPAVYAADSGNTAAAQEMPRNWAIEDVRMGYLLGLSDVNMLKGFQKGAVREDLYKLGAKLYEKLTGKEATPSVKEAFKDTNSASSAPSQKITRGEVVQVIFNVLKASNVKMDLQPGIKLVQKDAATLKEPLLGIAKYLYSKGVLQGYADKLGISSACSQEEMLVFVKRAYDFGMRETGKASKGLFYKVSGGKSQVYILGSVHITDMGIFPFNKCIEDAYAKADYLVEEANMNQEDTVYLNQKGLYTGGDTIDKHISADTYKLLGEVMKQFSIPPEQYNTYKPWFAALLAQGLAARQGVGATEVVGPDVYFLAKGDKKVLELEGLKFQADLLDGFGPDLQADFLQGSLEATKSDGTNSNLETSALTAMIHAWKKGDISGITGTEDTEGAPASMKEFYDKFWNARNINMAKKVEGFLNDAGGKTYFVVFGAGHLVGDTGVIKSLKTAGYKVEQVLN